MMNRKGILLLAIVSASLLSGCAHRGREIGIKPLAPDGLMMSGPIDTMVATGYRTLDDGKFGLAISQFRAALQIDPRSATAENGLAIAYASLGRLDLAERHFALAMTNAPDNGAYRRNHDRILGAQRAELAAVTSAAIQRAGSSAYGDRLSVPLAMADADTVIETPPAVLMLRTREPGRPILTGSTALAQLSSVRRTVAIHPLRPSPVAEDGEPVLERTGSNQIMLRIGATSGQVNAVPIRETLSRRRTLATSGSGISPRPAPAILTISAHGG